MAADLIQEVLRSSFHSSKKSREILKKITIKGGFSTENTVARLALARSLMEPKKIEEYKSADSGGKEIKGQIFLSSDLATLFAALVVQHAGIRLSPSKVKRQIKLHWDRGLDLLSRDLDELDGNFDQLLVNLAEKCGLKDEGLKREASKDAVSFLNIVIIGQDSAKLQVGRLLNDSVKNIPRILPETLIFTGPASTGKTLFAQTIAKFLRLPLVQTTGNALASSDHILEKIRRATEAEGAKPKKEGKQGGLPILRYPPSVVFIDEAHQLKGKVQDDLLTMTEPKQRRVFLDDQIADVQDVTFLFATTDVGKLNQPLKSRGRIIEMMPYSKSEVASIIQLDFPKLSKEIREQLAIAGRLIPRLAKQRAEDFERYMRQEHPDERFSRELLLNVMEGEWGQDSLGLRQIDYSYLNVLENVKAAIGVENIAQQLEIGVEQIENDIEPYLQALGLIQRTKAGRILTDKGENFIKTQK